MNNWIKYTLVALMVTAAGFAYFNNSRPHVPADLRDAVADSKEFDTTIPVLEKDNGNMPVPKAAVAVKTGAAIAESYLSGGAPSQPIEWISIKGGKFTMGTDSGEKGFEDARPSHEVTVKTFEMSKTAVTVAQYAECVAKGKCTAPESGDSCNWRRAGRRLHPVNCVDWDQANQYARFQGARLPSESEWEYAAKSGGKNQKYPWGNDEPTCDRVVMYGSGAGCSKGDSMPVCSRPSGNTQQGLCDMEGNVGQWVQDVYRDSYEGAPNDGSAYENGGISGVSRVLRGLPIEDNVPSFLRADSRNSDLSDSRVSGTGFRLARTVNSDAALPQGAEDKGLAMTAAKKVGNMACTLDSRVLGSRQYTMTFNLKKLVVDPLNNPIRVSPAQDFLEALNENISVSEKKGNIVISGDSDGFYLVRLTLNTASGFTKGDFQLEDLMEGSGNKRSTVTCTVQN